MRPRIAFFDFSGCRGCQLDTFDLTPEQFFSLIEVAEIVSSRLIMTEHSESCDVAFVEGSVTCESDIPRLQKIRQQAKVLVAFGTCACTGGINCLKNHLSMNEALQITYGKDARYYNTLPARPINAVVNVDHYVRGCPPPATQLLWCVRPPPLGKIPDVPTYPVCVECKTNENVCAFERGQFCLGPVTLAGCNAICINNGRHCWGCRGMVDNPNLKSEKKILKKYGLTPEQTLERFKIFNTYSGATR